MVLVLIVLVMFLAGAHGSFLHRMVVRSELEKITTVCSYLQRVAMMTHKPQKLTFDPAHNTYSYNDTHCALAPHVQFGVGPGIKGPPGGALYLVSKSVTFPGNSITFHPDGVIQAGTIYLTDSQKKNTYALTCSVAQVSYLRRYQYTDTWNLIS